jgi:hypothetical protein
MHENVRIQCNGNNNIYPLRCCYAIKKKRKRAGEKFYRTQIIIHPHNDIIP